MDRSPFLFAQPDCRPAGRRPLAPPIGLTQVTSGRDGETLCEPRRTRRARSPRRDAGHLPVLGCAWREVANLPRRRRPMSSPGASLLSLALDFPWARPSPTRSEPRGDGDFVCTRHRDESRNSRAIRRNMEGTSRGGSYLESKRSCSPSMVAARRRLATHTRKSVASIRVRSHQPFRCDRPRMEASAATPREPFSQQSF